MPASDELAPTPARPPWSVAALLLAASDALSARFGVVQVRGEVSGFSRAASGHCYFNLKDADGQSALLRCAMFRRAAALLDFAPADGQQVDLSGRISVYEARGELQLVVEGMRRVGSGALYEEFLRLRARLQAEGLFEAARKRVPPSAPAAVGIVTSAGAAALQDVLSCFARRSPQVRLVVYPSLVQGPQAPAAMVQALAAAGARAEVDTLLLVRGGGSLEDLWAFNDERVVRAVAASPMPVICGVGHETDLTLADLAADLRAPTPTAAAEQAAIAQADALLRLSALATSAKRAVRRRLDGDAQRLDALALRLGRPARGLEAQRQALQRQAQRLLAVVAQRRQRLATDPPRLADRLRQALAVHLRAQRQGLESRERRLQALDPQRVLRRGYAWIEDGQGQALTSARSIAVGSTVHAVWADGRAETEVKAVRLDPAPGPE